MSEEAKKNFAGALTARPNSDEPKPAPVPAVPPKKVIIKSADMIPDMQKEAVDIAVAVSFNDSLSLYLSLFMVPRFGFCFWVWLYLLCCVVKS